MLSWRQDGRGNGRSWPRERSESAPRVKLDGRVARSGGNVDACFDDVARSSRGEEERYDID